MGIDPLRQQMGDWMLMIMELQIFCVVFFVVVFAVVFVVHIAASMMMNVVVMKGETHLFSDEKEESGDDDYDDAVEDNCGLDVVEVVDVVDNCGVVEDDDDHHLVDDDDCGVDDDDDDDGAVDGH